VGLFLYKIKCVSIDLSIHSNHKKKQKKLIQIDKNVLICIEKATPISDIMISCMKFKNIVSE